jgi:hypothetical protein
MNQQGYLSSYPDALTPRPVTYRKHGCLGLFLSPFLGILVVWLLYNLNESGLGTPWKRLKKTPEPVVQILKLDVGGVWVKGASGAIYYTTYPQKCTSGCWEQVQRIPPDEFPTSGLPRMTPGTCVRGPLMIFMVDYQTACYQEVFFTMNYAAALASDGRVMWWQHSSGGEWAILVLFLDLMGGAVLGFFIGFVWFVWPPKQKITA